MKIENFSLNMHSESHKSVSTSITSFVTELDLENSKRKEETKKLDEAQSVKSELEFTQKLQFQLIQELLNRLSPQKCKLKALGKDFFKMPHVKEFTAREVTLKKEYTESQSMDVSMMGCVQTATQKIEINMNVSMSYSFTSEHQILKKQFFDPLVLNFDGELPDLDKKEFSFDIDCDGKEDQISMLKKGSGFLALDKNNNGKVDDGTELFGPLNGNGYADLKRYDSDHNDWIDENDPIFDKLRIWMKNKDEDKLVALGETGVGAIYLGSSQGQFELKNSDTNESMGRIRGNGLFLNEDGTSGFMSQIDFARENKAANKTEEPSNLNTLLKTV
jgi:hypothetical protein